MGLQITSTDSKVQGVKAPRKAPDGGCVNELHTPLSTGQWQSRRDLQTLQVFVSQTLKIADSDEEYLIKVRQNLASFWYFLVLYVYVLFFCYCFICKEGESRE